MEGQENYTHRRDFLVSAGAGLAAFATVGILNDSIAQSSKGAPKNILGKTSLDLDNFNKSAEASAIDLATEVNQYVPLEKELINFRTWHVEGLLNQASELIEKCLDELREYQSLDYSVNQFHLDLKVQEKDLELDQIRKGQGFLQREIVSLNRRFQYWKESEPSFGNSLGEAIKLYGYSESQGIGMPGWARNGQNMSEKKIEELARNMERDLIKNQLNWSEKDVNYYNDHLTLRAEVLEKKNELATQQRSFDLTWQRDLVGTLLERNFKDARRRAQVAEKGLKEIYGVDHGSSAPSPGLGLGDSINHLAIWIRNSIEWLVAYQQIDQAFTRIVSLKSLLNKTEWNSLNSSSIKNRFQVFFPIDLFNKHTNVRLRGVGASIIGEVGYMPWSISIGVPKKGIYQRANQRFKVDQSGIPICLLGRVESNKSFRSIEICGMISMMNASPIGQEQGEGASFNDRSWLIEIHKPNLGRKLKRLEDILIEIHAVGIPIIRS